MKIVHLCILAPYNDYWGYQDNLIPKYHRSQGHDVTVITTNTTHCDGAIKTIPTADYYLDDGQHIIRLSYQHFFTKKISRIIKRYNVFSILKSIRPDFIMVHGLGNITGLQVKKYLKKINPECIVVADNHTDYYNGKSLLTKKGKLFLKFYRAINKKMTPIFRSVYGVTPWRIKFQEEVLGTPPEKSKLLVMGADDDKIRLDRQSEIREEIRKKHGIDSEDFLIIAGGKIDRTKNIHLLIEAVKSIHRKKVKLLVFGQPVKDFEAEFKDIVNDERICYIGWLPSDSVYDYFLASDLSAFPGTHSVLWEQACACGIPGIFRLWEGMHHIDVGGNVFFLENDSTDSIKNILEEILNDSTKYENMKKSAMNGIETFFYSRIAKRVIEENK